MKKSSSLSRKAIVVHSPHAGQSARLSQALVALREAGMQIADLLPITALDGLPEQGTRWKAAGVDTVIAAGGDGLVGGVTPHIVGIGLPLGILPLGTANDVARSVHIPLDPRQAAETIIKGIPIAIDIGVAHSVEQTPSLTRIKQDTDVLPTSADQMYFTHALTVGLNVQFALLATNVAVRQRFGAMTYPFAVVEALRNYQPVDVEICFDGLMTRTNGSSTPVIWEDAAYLKCRAAQVTAINAPVFWGALQARVPGVNLNDRLLDIVIVEDASTDLLLWRITQFFSRQNPQPPGDPHGWHAQDAIFFAAELTDIPGIHHFQARGVTVTAIDGPRSTTLDGEVRGQTPIHAQAAAEQLRLFVPASSPFAKVRNPNPLKGMGL